MPLEVEVPKFISNNAERGLRYVSEGKGGDGMTDKTIRDLARTVIALPIEELLADAEGFVFARRFLRVRGYQVALDCRGPEQLPLLAAGTLGDDLLRLPWSAALAAQATLLPPNRGQVVLTGADRPAALGWGWDAGISLFEGPLLRLFARGE